MNMMNIVRIRLTFVVALVLVLTAVGLWAAGAEEEPAAAAEKEMVLDPTTGEMVEAPRYGGTLTYAERIEPPGTDPWDQGHGPRAVDGVAEKLAIGNWGIDRDEFRFGSRYVPLFAMRPNLAESWEQPDPLTLIFRIRPGVRWHNKPPMDGRELTAQDVEYNFNRYTGLGSGFTEPSPFDPMNAATWESITAIDDSTVVFKLKAPRNDALETIVSHWFHFIMPPEVIEQHGNVHDWRKPGRHRALYADGLGQGQLSDLYQESGLLGRGRKIPTEPLALY